MHLQRNLWVGHHRLCETPRVVVFHTSALEHRSELLGLGLGVALELAALEVQLALQQL